MGLLATDMVYEYVATAYQRLSRSTARRSQQRFEELEALRRRPARRGRHRRPTASSSSGSPTAATSARATSSASTRPLARSTTPGRRRCAADFHDIHEREYSRRFEESDIEIPNIRVRGIGLMPPLQTPEIGHGGDSPEAALRHEGEAWFRVDGAARAGADALLRAGRAQGRQPARRAGDRQPVRLDDGDPAGARGTRRPLREHRHRHFRAAARKWPRTS